MMHHEAGVRVVVAGGRPVTGPMQTASGTRGARVYTTNELDQDIELAQEIIEDSILADDSTNPFFLPNRTTELTFQVSYATINLRDQVRPNETVPLQFIYEAADCRIFYTVDTFYNYTLLWQYAADAIWTNSSLCVNGSTGFASTAGAPSDLNGPSPSSDAGTITANDILGHLNTSDTSKIPFLAHNASSIDDALPASNARVPASCKSTQDCINLGKSDHVCAIVELCDGNKRPEGLSKLCLKRCFNDPHGAPACRSTEKCLLTQDICDKPGHCGKENLSLNKGTLSPNSQASIARGVCDLICNGSGLPKVRKSGPS